MERDIVYLPQRKTEFRAVFEGTGKLPGGGDKYHYGIHLTPGAQPVQHPPRAVPEKKNTAYTDDLERLCNLGIIEPVDGHTKPDESIRLYLDPTDLNKNSTK